MERRQGEEVILDMSYPEEFREQIVRKYLQSKEKNVSKFVRENNVPKATFYLWLKKYEKFSSNSSLKSQEKIESDKFQLMCEYHALPKEKIGLWLRRKGLYSSDIERIRTEFMSKNIDKKEIEELKVLRQENAALKAELNRKDKALAETTALLVLKKKLELLLADEE